VPSSKAKQDLEGGHGLFPAIDRLLRWQTSPEIRPESLERAGEAASHTAGCGLLKQPDKQKLTN